MYYCLLIFRISPNSILFAQLFSEIHTVRIRTNNGGNNSATNFSEKERFNKRIEIDVSLGSPLYTLLTASQIFLLKNLFMSLLPKLKQSEQPASNLAGGLPMREEHFARMMDQLQVRKIINLFVFSFRKFFLFCFLNFIPIHILRVNSLLVIQAARLDKSRILRLVFVLPPVLGAVPSLNFSTFPRKLISKRPRILSIFFMNEMISKNLSMTVFVHVPNILKREMLTLLPKETDKIVNNFFILNFILKTFFIFIFASEFLSILVIPVHISAFF